MARKSFTQLRADINANVYQNAAGEITGASLNALMQDINDTLTPGYGVMSLLAPATVNIPDTFTDLVFWNDSPVVTAEFSTNELLGQITAQIPMVFRSAVSMTVEGPSNEQLDLRYTRSDGTATGPSFFASVQGAGAGRPVGISLTGLFDIVNAPEAFTLQGKNEAGSANWTFDQASWICELTPLIDNPVPPARNFG